jgi:hypothetical protein
MLIQWSQPIPLFALNNKPCNLSALILTEDHFFHGQGLKQFQSMKHKRNHNTAVLF